MRRGVVFLFSLGFCCFAQNPCGVSATGVPPKEATMFSPEQDGYLGDIIAETMQRRLKIYRQPGLLGPVENIAARLTRYLPSSQFQFRFSLIELPEANAFALPGGRIYISRRLIAFVRSEDELAGIIAHEMGHVVARQSSIDMTKTLRQVLKVTSVGGRDDIFQKFNQLLDSANRKPGGLSREDDDQLVADRISLEVAWRAGYDPQGLPRFLDRL